MQRMMAAACAGGLACAAAAQDVVVFGQVTETRQVEAACFRLFGADCPRVRDARGLAEALDAGVTLAVIEYYFDLPQADKDLLLPALERHIDRGGRVLLAYTELDEWQALQKFVGVQTILDVTVPLEVWSVDPPHPTWASAFPSDPLMRTGDYWLDNGDFLMPDSGVYILATWQRPEGAAAMVLARNGRVLLNSFDFDSYDGDGIDRKIAAQMEWLLDCKPDIDGDGALTFFDFLAFQNLFIASDLTADFAFDGQLNFFDFLAFQDQFSIGCP